MISPRILHLATLYTIEIGWICFAAIFLFRPKRSRQTVKNIDRVSINGIVLQTLALFAIWALPKRRYFVILPLGRWFDFLVLLLVLVIVVGSLWIMSAALRALGKQWSLQARMLDDHALIRSGPYRFVRHPIYTGMLGMILAAAIAWSNWLGFIVSIALFAIGTTIRIRSEEKLLRAQFGDAFDDYKREVPAVIPLKFHL